MIQGDTSVHRLSWLVFRQLMPDWGDGQQWDGEWPGAHPRVCDLVEKYGGDGPRAALAWLEGTAETDAFAVVEWMRAGAFKGRFRSVEDFAYAQFAGAIEDQFDRWTQRAAIGFPSVNLSDMIPWEAIGEALAYEEPRVFDTVAAEQGVYVFDISISIDGYRRQEAGGRMAGWRSRRRGGALSG
jgi:hypothetical protein